MKMIMPIARPAAVSVIQLEVEPISGQPIAARTATSSSGSQSNSRRGSAAALGAEAIDWFMGKDRTRIGPKGNRA